MTYLNNPTKRLFVGSLPYQLTEGQLLELFVPFGRIISIKIMHTPWGKSRGLGFVEFDNLESAIQAKTSLHNHYLGDRSIIVDYAQEDPAKTPEGQQRHQNAIAKNPAKFKQEGYSDSKPNRTQKFKSFDKKNKTVHPDSPEDFEHKRQTVYDARHYHSKVGKKFASRNKKK